MRARSKKNKTIAGPTCEQLRSTYIRSTSHSVHVLSLQSRQIGHCPSYCDAPVHVHAPSSPLSLSCVTFQTCYVTQTASGKVARGCGMWEIAAIDGWGRCDCGNYCFGKVGWGRNAFDADEERRWEARGGVNCQRRCIVDCELHGIVIFVYGRRGEVGWMRWGL